MTVTVEVKVHSKADKDHSFSKHYAFGGVEKDLSGHHAKKVHHYRALPHPDSRKRIVVDEVNAKRLRKPAELVENSEDGGSCNEGSVFLEDVLVALLEGRI